MTCAAPRISCGRRRRPISSRCASDFVLTAAIVGLATVAPGAAPDIRLSRFSSPNPHGWHNSPVALTPICAPGLACPAQLVITTGGIHRLDWPLGDMGDDGAVGTTDGRYASTGPADRMLRLPERIETSHSAIQVTAEIADAPPAWPGYVQRRAGSDHGSALVTCSLTLLPEINDVVVEASDLAGNSGSAGARVVRTGQARTIRVVPEMAAVKVGASLRSRCSTISIARSAARNGSSTEWTWPRWPWTARACWTAASPGRRP